MLLTFGTFVRVLGEFPAGSVKKIRCSKYESSGVFKKLTVSAMIAVRALDLLCRGF